MLFDFLFCIINDIGSFQIATAAPVFKNGKMVQAPQITIHTHLQMSQAQKTFAQGLVVAPWTIAFVVDL